MSSATSHAHKGMLVHFSTSGQLLRPVSIQVYILAFH